MTVLTLWRLLSRILLVLLSLLVLAALALYWAALRAWATIRLPWDSFGY